MHSNWLYPVSRALIALIFILSGISKLTNFDTTWNMMANNGIPATTLMLIGAIAVEILGGVAILIGFMTRWAALALIIFMIPTTLIFHAANMSDTAQGQQQLIQVLKNLAIIGGLLKFMLDGAGAYSVDEHRVSFAHRFR
jgi:putative oxidoreductase